MLAWPRGRTGEHSAGKADTRGNAWGISQQDRTAEITASYVTGELSGRRTPQVPFEAPGARLEMDVTTSSRGRDH